MKTKKNPDAALDKAIEAAWYRLASGVQVSILDIPKIFRDVRLEVSGGLELDAAVAAVRDRFRKN